MKCQERFNEIYKREAEALAFCPYRVCPVGAHSDANLGKITGLAIDKGIHLAYSPKHNGVIELCSLQFDKRAQFHVRDVPKHKCDDWADYLRGATLKLGERYPLTYGLSGVIEGSLPIGGLSSSAAVALVFLKALCNVNNIQPTPLEMILISMAAENDYVGVNSGKLDQSCEVYSKKNHLLYLDTKTDEYELIPTLPTMKPYRIAVFFSGIERTLAGSKFNMRVDEARSAAYALMAYAGMEYGNSTAWNKAWKPGAEETSRHTGASVSKADRAAFRIGKRARQNSKCSTTSCDIPTASTADASAEQASKAAAWRSSTRHSRRTSKRK